VKEKRLINKHESFYFEMSIILELLDRNHMCL